MFVYTCLFVMTLSNQIIETSSYILPTGTLPSKSGTSNHFKAGVKGGSCEEDCVDWRLLNCEYGYTLDSCNRCYICALYPGKVCGGKLLHKSFPHSTHRNFYHRHFSQSIFYPIPSAFCRYYPRVDQKVNLATSRTLSRQSYVSSKQSFE